MFIEYVKTLQTVFASDGHVAERRVLRQKLTAYKGKSQKLLVE
jgi:hypothetical protein